MKKTVLAALAVILLAVACSSAPKPKTVDGSQREPVNKTIIQGQTGGTNGR